MASVRQKIKREAIFAKELALPYVKSVYTSGYKQFSNEIQEGNEKRQFSPCKKMGPQKHRFH